MLRRATIVKRSTTKTINLMHCFVLSGASWGREMAARGGVVQVDSGGGRLCGLEAVGITTTGVYARDVINVVAQVK